MIDVRGADEHARERIAGAVNVPLDRIGALPRGDVAVVFHCRSGMRTAANLERLTAAARGAPAYILEGGIGAWRAEGLPVVADRTQPIAIMRQVQIAAGTLVLTGVVLGQFVAPDFSVCRRSSARGWCLPMRPGGAAWLACFASCRGTDARQPDAVMDATTVLAAFLSGS